MKRIRKMEIMKKFKILSKLNNVVWHIFSYILLVSPFVIGYYLWILLLPTTCIEKILSIVLILGICSIEAFFSWMIGIFILEN